MEEGTKNFLKCVEADERSSSWKKQAYLQAGPDNGRLQGAV
jgi:hypothetical protein